MQNTICLKSAIAHTHTHIDWPTEKQKSDTDRTNTAEECIKPMSNQ